MGFVFLFLNNSARMSTIGVLVSLFSPMSFLEGVKAFVLLASGVFEELKADTT